MFALLLFTPLTCLGCAGWAAEFRVWGLKEPLLLDDLGVFRNGSISMKVIGPHLFAQLNALECKSCE